MSITHDPAGPARLLPVVEAHYPISAREWPGPNEGRYAYSTHVHLQGFKPAELAVSPWRFIVREGQLDALLQHLQARHVPASVVGVVTTWPEPAAPQWPSAEAASLDMLQRYPNGLERSWTAQEAADYWTLCWGDSPDPYNRSETRKHNYAWGHVQRFTSLAAPMRSRGKGFYLEALNIVRLREQRWPVTAELEPAYALLPIPGAALQK